MKLVFLIAIALSIQINSFACSAFTLKSKSDVFVGKSYDWSFDSGMLMVNPRGISKKSMPVVGNYKTIEWTSKYASFSFNQCGQALPNSGMNEKGLTIEILVYRESDYGKITNEYAVNELQWIQYCLDNYKSVAELIEQTGELKISPMYAKVHYYIADANGNSAVVEYLAGKRVVSYKQTLPVSAITNSSYQSSIKGFEQNKGGCSRFNSICENINQLDQNQSSDELLKTGFNILDQVKSEKRTQWQIVYDLKKLEVHFRTKSNTTIKSIKLNDFNIVTLKKAVYADLNKSEINPTDFREITSEVNHHYLSTTFKALHLKISDRALQPLVAFISTGVCSPHLQTIVNQFERYRRHGN